jgi:alkylation response protein AidB-like acyl-CoA dehydrogenase
VVADAGLGLTGLRRALCGADVKHVIGVARGLTAAKGMGLRGTGSKDVEAKDVFIPEDRTLAVEATKDAEHYIGNCEPSTAGTAG